MLKKVYKNKVCVHNAHDDSQKVKYKEEKKKKGPYDWVGSWWKKYSFIKVSLPDPGTQHCSFHEEDTFITRIHKYYYN